MKLANVARCLALGLILPLTPQSLSADSRASRASQSYFLVVVDETEHIALIPEGSVVPTGVRVMFKKSKTKGERPESLVFAYAPESRLAEARTAIEDFDSQLNTSEEPTRSEARTSGTIIGTPGAWVYVYLPDGSLHRSYLQPLGGNWQINTYVDVKPYADGRKRVEIADTFTLPFRWVQEKSCWIPTSGSTCYLLFASSTMVSGNRFTSEADLTITVPCHIDGMCSEYYTSVIQYSIP